MAKTAAGHCQTYQRLHDARGWASRRSDVAAAGDAAVNAAPVLTSRALKEVSARLADSFAHYERPAPEREWRLTSAALTTLLFESDVEAVARFVESVCCRHRDALGAQVALLERAERRLGECWRRDQRSETEILLAEATLMRAFRVLNAPIMPAWPPAATPPLVLVASWSGEAHLLPAIVVAEVLWRAGWGPIVEFPHDDAVMERALANHAFDAAVVSLSGVFTRLDRVADVAASIRQMRHASKNPNLIIAVTGRAAAEHGEELSALGADVLAPSARHIHSAIEEAIARRAH